MAAAAEEKVHDGPDFAPAGPRRHVDRQPRSDLRRQRQDLVLGAAQHHPVQLHGQFFEVRRAVGLPAEVGLLRGAVAFREREEAPSE